MRKKDKTYKLVLAGILIALSFVLSFIKIFSLPYGGSVTLCSMLPIAFYGYKYGMKWGVFAGFTYAVLQLVLDAGKIRALGGVAFAGSIIFDYLIAFTVLGLAGIFKNKFKNKSVSFVLGVCFVILLRYVAHIISGVLCYAEYAEWYFSQDGFALGQWILSRFNGFSLSLLYSSIYNFMYILPELIITCIAAFLITKFAAKFIED